MSPVGVRPISPLKINRTKTSEAVVEFLLDQIFHGELRPGDRVQVGPISESLGISQSPVREALLLLERDGVVSSTLNRGAYVEPFDAQSILDDFEVYGTLSGIAVRRLAARRDPQVVAELQRLIAELRAVPHDEERFADLTLELMRVEHEGASSNRLRADLRSFAAFLPSVVRTTARRSKESAVRSQSAVVDAIAAGDGERAARCRLEETLEVGQEVVRELVRRGVLDPDEPDGRLT